MAIDWERVVAVSDNGSVESFGIERIILVTGQKGDKGDKGDKGERGDLDSLVWGNIIGNITNQQDLINYIEQSHPVIDAYTKEETDDFIDDLQDQIDNINNFKIHTCVSGEYDATTHVPTIQNPDTTTFYLVPTGTENDIYEEWIYLNNNWERFGSAKIDLSSYYTKTQTDSLLDAKADKTTTYTKTETDALLDEKADATDVTSALALKADTTDVTAALALKADQVTTYTKTETDGLLDEKVDQPIVTVTGAPITITDGAENNPIERLILNIAPQQSGSGEPSSSNIRPFIATSVVNITHANDETSETISVTIPVEEDTSNYLGGGSAHSIGSKGTLICNGSGLQLSGNQFYVASRETVQTNVNATLGIGKYHFNFEYDSDNFIVSFRKEYGSYSTQTIRSGKEYLITVYEDTKLYLNVSFQGNHNGSTQSYNWSLNKLTSQFYGGTIDFINGTITKTKEFINSYSGESIQGEWYSDRDVYTEGSMPTYGAQVVYNASNPETYQITPSEISSYYGNNYFSYNGLGNFEITYHADLALYLQNALNAKADASSVYTKTETNTFINNLQNQIDNLNSFDIHICVSGEYDPTTLIPTIANPDSSTVYLVSSGDGNDLYDEWIYVNNRWEKFGSARIDLSDYVTKEQLAEEINIENNYESENGVLVVKNTSSTDKIDEIICHYPPSLTGINWLQVNIYNKNLIQSGRTYVNPSTQKGVTFTTNTDGSISFSGTPTEDIDIMCDCDTITLPVGRYIFSGGIDENNYIYIGNNTIKSTGNDRSCTVNVKGWFSVHLCITNTGNPVSGTFYPMIRHESILDNTYVKGEQNNHVYERIGTEASPINIYGGYYNFVTAQLTVTHKHIDSYNGEALPGEWISDRDTYSPGTTPTIGASVTYELAEPEISIEDNKWVNVHANEEVSVFMSNYFNDFSVKMNQKLKDVINTLKQYKQDKLTFDNTPSSGSTNPVTSNGIATALALKADKTETYTKTQTDSLLDTKQDTLTFDNVPTAGSNNPVKSSGIKSALDEKANSTDVYTKTESDALLNEKVTDNIELTSTATQNYTAGSLAIVQNQLIRVTQNIATGGSITIGSNAETIDLETLIAEKAEKILVAKLPFLSSADLYNNTADFHNAMPRGKDITSYFTDGSLWDRINGVNGYSLFEDLYVGDYLTAGGQDYMIVDFDYYIRCGDGMDITQHHLIMMPTGSMSIPEGTVLYGSVDTLTLINTANYREHTGDDTVTVSSQETAVYKKWNATIDAPNTNTTAGGYKFSRMRQVIMKAADTIIVNAFGLTHIKPIPVLYPNPANAEASGLASNWTWYKDTDWTSDLRRSICDLPNETQIYGQQVWGKGSAWNTGGHEVGVDKWQFALFKNNRARANIRATWWLRSVYSAANACYVNYAGYATYNGTSYAFGVRPRFLLFG